MVGTVVNAGQVSDSVEVCGAGGPLAPRDVSGEQPRRHVVACTAQNTPVSRHGARSGPSVDRAVPCGCACSKTTKSEEGHIQFV
eukprot:6466798-Prymnesium_polylepis.1